METWEQLLSRRGLWASLIAPFMGKEMYELSWCQDFVGGTSKVDLLCLRCTDEI